MRLQHQDTRRYHSRRKLAKRHFFQATTISVPCTHAAIMSPGSIPVWADRTKDENAHI